VRRGDGIIMKIRTISLAAKWCLLISILFFAGCAHEVSLEERGNEWIARPLAELKQAMKSPDSYASKIDWQEKTYPLADGYYAYVEPLGPDCAVHWRINQRDMIVDYQNVGAGCRQSSTDNNNIWNLSPKASKWNF
jgi:hypothetical protein